MTSKSQSCIVITLYCHVVLGPRLQSRNYPSGYTAHGDLDTNGVIWYNKKSNLLGFKYSLYDRTTAGVDLKIEYCLVS